MTKLFTLLVASITLFGFVSCSTSKIARNYSTTVDGKWILNTVVTEGITGKFKATVFNEEDFECFIGSTWMFNNNNNLGSYAISKNAGVCAAVTRNIRWSIYEPKGLPKEFQFKRVDAKYKEMDNGAGFRFTILQLDATTMVLKNDFQMEGKPVSFLYNFKRI